VARTRPALGQTTRFPVTTASPRAESGLAIPVGHVAEWDSAEALHAATSQDFFQQSTQRSMHELAVAAHPAVYRVVIEATAE